MRLQYKRKSKKEVFLQLASSAPSSRRTLSSSLSAVTAAPCRVGESLVVDPETSASGEHAPALFTPSPALKSMSLICRVLPDDRQVLGF